MRPCDRQFYDQFKKTMTFQASSVLVHKICGQAVEKHVNNHSAKRANHGLTSLPIFWANYFINNYSMLPNIIK